MKKSIPGSKHRKFKLIRQTTSKIPAKYKLKTDLLTIYWQNDEDAPQCPWCDRSFNIFLRCHHCRSCGLVLCDDDCHEEEHHDNERVCKFCLDALEQLNQQAIEEHKERHRTVERVKFELGTILEKDMEEREEILNQEDEFRVAVLEFMTKEEMKITDKIHGDVSEKYGTVSHLERRRTGPIYGIRGGKLKLNIKRLRNLQPVKSADDVHIMNLSSKHHHNIPSQNNHSNSNNNIPSNLVSETTTPNEKNSSNINSLNATNTSNEPKTEPTTSISAAELYESKIRTSCHPVVQIEINKKIVARSEKAEIMLCLKSIAHDFTIKEEFEFDIEDDRTGVIIRVLDEKSMDREGYEPITSLLGLSWMNLRKRGVLEEVPVLSEEEIQSREQERQLLEEQQAALKMIDPKKASAVDVDTSDEDRENGCTSCSAKTCSSEDVTATATTSSTTKETRQRGMTEINQIRVAAGLSAVTSGGSSGSNKNNDNFIKFGINANNNNNKKKEFARYCERGETTRPLCDREGNPLMASQIVIHWTFHPYKQDLSSHLARHVVCPGCQQRDAVGYCTCDGEEKQAEDEASIRKRIAKIGSELYEKEIEARKARIAKIRSEHGGLLPGEKVDTCGCF